MTDLRWRNRRARAPHASFNRQSGCADDLRQAAFTVLFAPHTMVRQKLHDGDPRSLPGDDHGPLSRCLLPAPRARLRRERRGARRSRSPRPTRAPRARVVSAQLEAFAKDDAKRAFSYAAPSIRAMFGTPERFLAMVRAGYPVVYRAAGVTFLHPAAGRGRSRPGRPPHRWRRRALARHLPARAPARRESGASPAATCSRRPAR